MNKSTVRLLAAAALAVVTALPASAASVVNVYFGYFNNFNGSVPSPADIPTPFDTDATTTLIGLGTTSPNNDTGVIRFENASNLAVTIGPFVGVFVNSQMLSPWGLLGPFLLAPGHNLVLSASADFNFDTSEFVGQPFAQVFASINGRAEGFNDEHFVLFGHNDAVDAAETTPYELIRSVQVPSAVPVPGAVLLFGSALAGLVAVGRRRAA